jgi:DNA-binding FrmR family transcriptional regulator
MKTNEQRINNIIGQLAGAKKMLADKQADCFSSLIQLKASRSAISSLMDNLIEDEFKTCLSGRGIKSREKINKIFKEVLKK